VQCDAFVLFAAEALTGLPVREPAFLLCLALCANCAVLLVRPSLPSEEEVSPSLSASWHRAG